MLAVAKRVRGPLPVFLCLLLLTQSLLAASAKLVVKNARLFTMAPQQREPFMGYLVVGEDGSIVTVGREIRRPISTDRRSSTRMETGSFPGLFLPTVIFGRLRIADLPGTRRSSTGSAICI